MVHHFHRHPPPVELTRDIAMAGPDHNAVWRPSVFIQWKLLHSTAAKRSNDLIVNLQRKLIIIITPQSILPNDIVHCYKHFYQAEFQ